MSARLLITLALLSLLVAVTFATDAQSHRHARSSPRLIPASPPLSASGRELGVNRLASADVDCPLKVYAAQFASYLQPQRHPHVGNWTEATVEALQLPSLCKLRAADIPPPPFIRPSTVPPAAPRSCSWLRYVDGTNGNDSNPGTLESPWRDVARAVGQSRTRPPRTSACIYVRAGVHWFGDHKENYGLRYESQTGALSLTAADSGLTLSAYENERVVFSAGLPLTGLQWTTHAKTAAGTIMKAQLPDSVDASWDHFNELYVDGNAAIRAKFPNGDPFTTGRHTNPTGYVEGADSWIAPDSSIPPAAEIHVSQPAPNSSYFPQFQIGVEGTVRDFEPPRSYWALANPPGGGGSTYVRPLGFVWNDNFSPRAANWSNPSTGLLFAYHCDSWGSWQFAIDSVLPANKTVMLGRGAFQEARGCGSGSSMYVHNILEELDAVNEWFVDAASRTLYFMPNDSSSLSETQFVASQVPCVISLHGDRQLPVQNVTIRGLTFAHTPNNFLRQYEVPSGGDYSVHRGAALFLQGVENVRVEDNSFLHLGSNALFVSNYAVNTVIAYNSFRWLGESAVLLVGQTAGIDGVSNIEQPTSTHVEGNIAADFSVYVKQGDAIFESLARNSVWAANLAFNSPRSIFNKNDGFAGGLQCFQNLLFNSNRETSDHGPINTWDREPYLTDNGGRGPSVVPRINQIHNNFLINDYGSDFSVDHDDGSAYYRDHHNFYMYSGTKNFLGHSKRNDHQLFVYADLHPGYGQPVCFQDDSGENYDAVWSDNRCLLLQTFTPYYIAYCDPSRPQDIPTHNRNQFYTPDASLNFSCGSAYYTLQQWQRFSGQDADSTVAKTPDVDTVIGWGNQILYLSDGRTVDREVSW